MKFWAAIVGLLLVAGSCLSLPAERTKLSHAQLKELSELMKTLNVRKDEFAAKADNVKFEKLELQVGEKCFDNDDCSGDQICLDMVEVTTKFLAEYDALQHYDVITKKANIEGKECWADRSEAIKSISADELLEKIVKSKVFLRDVYTYFDDRYITLQRPDSLMLNSTEELEIDNVPVVRQGAGMDMNTLMMILMLRGSSGTSTLDALLPIILMQSAGGAGVGGELMSNPFMLMLLLNNKPTTTTGGTSTADLTTMMLMMSIMQGGNAAVGGGVGDLMSSPLLLMTLLGKDSNSILPLLLMTGGLGEGGSDLMSNPLMMMLLLKDKPSTTSTSSTTSTTTTTTTGTTTSTTGTLNDMLPLLLISSMKGKLPSIRSSMGGAGEDINSMLPLIMLMKKDGVDNKMMIMMMMMNMGGAGNLGSMLPILLMNDKDMKTEDLLLFMMMGQEGADMNSMLPILLLLDKDNTATTITASTIDKLLPLMLMGGGLGGDGIMQGMLPLLLMSSGIGGLKSDDLLMMMVLGGGGLGGGNMQSMLPLLLLWGKDDKTTTTGTTTGTTTASTGLDTTMLMLIMMMGQVQPGTVVIDPVTGVAIQPQSPLNLMLPLLLSKNIGGGSNDMLLMMMIMSQQSTQQVATVFG